MVVSRSISELFKLNFTPLLEQTRKSLEKWSKLPVSLIGRINSIKMNTLPKFLYLFQTIPIYIKKSFFTHLNKIISSYIWNKKPPRIRLDFLQNPKEQGGMALPNFQLYYWACNLRAMTYWQDSHQISHLSDWVQIESSACLPFSLSTLLFSPLPLGLDSHVLHPMVWNSVRIWVQIRKFFGWQRGSICAPVARNHQFTQPLNDRAFLLWQEKGILTFKDLFANGSFLSFMQLESQFNLPKTHFFRYLQARDFTRKNFISFPSLPDPNP